MLSSLTGALAQDGGNGTYKHNGTVKTEEILDIKIINDDLEQFFFNTAEEFEQGIEQTQATRIRVKANTNWQVTFAANQENFSGTTATPMPVGIISIGQSGGSLYPLSVNNSQPIAQGTNGDENKTGHKFFLDYKANPGYDYDPGVYDIDIVYTISAQ